MPVSHRDRSRAFHRKFPFVFNRIEQINDSANQCHRLEIQLLDKNNDVVGFIKTPALMRYMSKANFCQFASFYRCNLLLQLNLLQRKKK